MFVCLKMKFQNDDGSYYVLPRVIHQSNILWIEPHPNNPTQCYAVIKDIPEVDSGSLEPILLEHAFEKLAELLHCETDHMDGQFSLKSIPAERTSNPKSDYPEP